MVKTAFVKLWGETVGAVAWDETQRMAFFEYDKKFLAKNLEVSPIKMPLSKQIYSFSLFFQFILLQRYYFLFKVSN